MSEIAAGFQRFVLVPPGPFRIVNPMPAAKPFAFVCGADDFLVGRLGRERFDALVAEAGADEFSREIISGFAGNMGEVEIAVNRLRESIQTVPMFGGRRVVWLKDVNFLADTVTGRAEGTLKLVEDLQALLEKIMPAETAVLITAAPVDRRRSFPKWCEKHADCTLIGGDGEGAAEALAGLVLAESRALGVTFEPDALQLLLAKVGANTRLLIAETHKLATYAAEGTAITEAQVGELTPNVAEGDFFEAAEAFFSDDLRWTLAALQRHFFAGGDARPVISSLQNRNRLLLQVRALLDAGDVRVGPRGLDGLPRAQAAYAAHFAGATEKSSYHLFTQNPWYLGKLAAGAKLPALRRLIDNQQEFVAAFEEIIARPREQEAVLRDLAVRCLGTV
ncbi:MAG: DNA polymerase III subunit delta [Verrucomicrobiota bacterium]